MVFVVGALFFLRCCCYFVNGNVEVLDAGSGQNNIPHVVQMPYTFESSQKPIVVGIAGGTGSGKTTLAESLVAALGIDNIAYIAHDSYYRGIGNQSLADGEKMNFDHPDSLETSLLVDHVQHLLAYEDISVPIYDFGTHTRRPEVIALAARPVILVEGILIFSDRQLVDLIDIKVFVDADDDIRFIRRLQRDIVERDRTLDKVAAQYMETVRPMHSQFVAPSKAVADIIIPGAKSFEVVVALLVCRLHSFLNTSK